MTTLNILSDAFAEAARASGFILVHPLHAAFAEGKSGWQRGRPKLINLQHIIEIDISKRECLITLTNETSITVNRDELLAVLRIEQCN